MTLEQQPQKSLKSIIGSVTHSYAIDCAECPQDEPILRQSFYAFLNAMYQRDVMTPKDYVFYMQMFEMESVDDSRRTGA